MKGVIIPILFGIAVLCFAYLANRYLKEGFDNMPTIAQESMISSDIPGATTSNPTVALAQPKDIQSLQESAKNLNQLMKAQNPNQLGLSPDTQQKLNKFIQGYSNLSTTLMIGLAIPNSPNAPSAAYVAENQQLVDSLISEIRGKTTDGIRTLETPPTVSAGTPGTITMKELNELDVRIRQEILRLSNLRSSSPTITNRIAQLEKLSADVGDIITSVKQGKMKLDDVPIKPDSADSFLRTIKNPDSQPLIAPQGSMTAAVKAPPSAPTISNPAVQGLLQNAQYLKWNIQLNLEFNPENVQRAKLLETLDAMESHLSRLAVSDTPVEKHTFDEYKHAMKRIQESFTDTTKSPPIDIPKASSSRTTVPFSTPDYPSSAQLASVQGQDSRAYTNPDINIRPGFMMNDDTIARRASSSAFDTATVGGPDYKHRALELCKQINSADLGNPVSFGCIENPDAVGSTYSWKGNYEMVCNRIGDTWGGWYPEMFGCQKHDPTAKFKGTML